MHLFYIFNIPIFQKKKCRRIAKAHYAGNNNEEKICHNIIINEVKQRKNEREMIN